MGLYDSDMIAVGDQSAARGLRITEASSVGIQSDPT